MRPSKDVLNSEIDLSPELINDLAQMVAEPSHRVRQFSRTCQRLLAKDRGSGTARRLVEVLTSRLAIDEGTAAELLRRLLEMDAGDEAGPTISALPMRERLWDEELAAFLRLRPELQRKYPGKFVAFEDGEVIAVGDTGQATAQEACRLTGQIKSRLVRHVDESDDAVDIVHIRLDKPRSVEMEIEQ